MFLILVVCVESSPEEEHSSPYVFLYMHIYVFVCVVLWSVFVYLKKDPHGEFIAVSK